MLRIVAAFVLSALTLPAQKKPITIDTIMQADHGHEGGGTPIWAPDGKHFAYHKGKTYMLYDVPAKSEKELLSLEPLEKVAVKPPEEERFDWQNRRVTED